MKIYTALLPVLGLSVLLAGGAASAQSYKSASPKMADQDTKTVAKIGEAAPDFSLTDTDGKTHKLSDYKGKVVVLQWINPDCPVCRRVMSTGIVSAMMKDVKQVDPTVVQLMINSTHYMDAEESAKYREKHEVAAPALIDKDGKVGRMYNARTTPHMFVIDAAGILRYEGAIDDDPRGGNSKRMNYVVNAVTQIKAGETVAPDSTRAYGCSVKYASK